MTLPAELRYRLLLELSQRISRTLDLQVVLQDLLQALRSAVAYDAAGVFVLNRAVAPGAARRSQPDRRHGTARLRPPARRRSHAALGRGIIGHVIHTGEMVNVPRRAPRPALHLGAGGHALRAGGARSWSQAGVHRLLSTWRATARRLFSPADAELPGVLRQRGRALHREGAAPPRGPREAADRGPAEASRARCSPGCCRRAAARRSRATTSRGRNLPTWAIGGDYYDYVPLGEGRLGPGGGRRLRQGHSRGADHGHLPRGRARRDARATPTCAPWRRAQRRGARVRATPPAS